MFNNEDAEALPRLTDVYTFDTLMYLVEELDGRKMLPDLREVIALQHQSKLINLCFCVGYPCKHIIL